MGAQILSTAWAGKPLDERGASALPLNLESPLLAAASAPEEPVLNLSEAAVPGRRPVTTNVTINLIRRMVEHKLIPQAEAEELIKQAQTDADLARAEMIVTQQTAERAAERAQAAAVAVSQAGPSADVLAGEDSMRVTYIPESVKAEMREQIKQEMMDQARAERWAAPRMLPEWSTKIRLFGDVRVRYEGTFFPDGNDNTGAFPNFNAINTGAPFDTSGTIFSPQLNVDQERERFRIRVRLGAEADLGFGFSAGVRLATGESNTPVTTNQSLGLANQGQGGNFTKYAIWLDRGFLKYEIGKDPNRSATLTVGRFDNPFFATSVLWAYDLGFDGALFKGKYKLGPVTPFLTAGAFPVFNTDYNFSSIRPGKFQSNDKYLYAGQSGFDLKIKKDFNFKAAVAYYHFEDVQGKLSDPFVPLNPQDQGNTDDSRPAFAQNGNTYRPIRNIVPTAANNFGTINQFQYFGLASKFHELALTGRLDYNRWEPVQVSLHGEYVKNLGFKGGDISQVAINNRRAISNNGTIGQYAGGDTAWIVGIIAGHPALNKRWAWNLGVNYRHVESDSLVDGFADADFGAPLYGTNLEGYTIYGNLALTPNVAVGVRWMSADSIVGAPFSSDVLQVDLSGSF